MTQSRAVGLLLFGTLALALTPIAWFWYQVGNPWGPAITTLIATLLFGLYIGINWRSLASVDPMLWIPVFLFLFSFGMPVAVDLLGGFRDYDAWNLGKEAPRLDQAFAVALLAFVAFLFGAHLAGLAPMKRISTRDRSGERDLVIPGGILMLIGTAMLMLGVVVAGPGLLLGSYGDQMTARQVGAADFRLIAVGSVFGPAGAMAMIASHRPGRWAPTLAALLAFMPVLMLNLATGDRSNVMVIGITAAWVYGQRVRRLRFGFVLLAFLVGFLSGPIVGEYRQFKTTQVLDQESFLRLGGASFYEMGSTVQVFAYTLEKIPGEKPYAWGLSLADPLVDLFPNLLPTVSMGTFLDPLEYHTALWVTATANPDKVIQKGGYGYALGAEWYFNFGIPGVLLGMILTGYLTGRVRNASVEGPLKLVWSALVFGMLALVVRNAVGAPLKMTVWPMVALLGLSYFMRMLFGSTQPVRRPGARAGALPPPPHPALQPPSSPHREGQPRT